MFHVVLYQPEIPPNTGNVIRLCAATGATLHLIEPMGFRMDDRRLKRAGLDYHRWVRIERHANWPRFLEAAPGGRLFAFTTRATMRHADVAYRAGDVFVFGPETRGLPAAVLEAIGKDHCLRLPMLPDRRSLNLSNAVAVALYEAWRQLDFEGPPTEAPL